MQQMQKQLLLVMVVGMMQAQQQHMRISSLSLIGRRTTQDGWKLRK